VSASVAASLALCVSYLTSALPSLLYALLSFYQGPIKLKEKVGYTKVTMTDMQEFYERWANKDPILHLSPSLPDGFLFRSIKSGWFEMAEEETDAATDAVAVGKRILVREIRKTDNTIVQYGSEKTEKGWTRHIVAFRQGEESPFPLPDVAIPATATSSATAFASASSFASSCAS
jgi:hypothetical protein